MRKHSILICISATAAAVIASSWPANAHHGWGAYGEDQFELTGTLETPIDLSGPHAETTMLVNGAVWDVVLAPVAATERAGLDGDAIPVGATVTASGHRHLDGQRLEMKAERLTWNDTVFDVYPGRN